MSEVAGGPGEGPSVSGPAGHTDALKNSGSPTGGTTQQLPVRNGEHVLPGAISTASVLMCVVAALAFVQAVLSVLASPMEGAHLAVGLVSVSLGIAFVVFLRGTRRGNATARTAAVALSGLSLLGGAFQLETNPVGGLVGVLLNGGIIFLLTLHPESRRFFGHRAGLR